MYSYPNVIIHRLSPGILQRFLSLLDLLVLRHPPHSLPGLPDADLHLLALRLVLAEPLLLPVQPLPIVLSPVRPGVNSVAVLLIVNVHALVFPTVGPVVAPLTVHVVVEPKTGVLAAVKPFINALARDHVVNPLASVRRTICISISTYLLTNLTRQLLPYPSFCPSL